MQSQGGFSTARRRGEKGVSGAGFLLLLQLLGSPEQKSEPGWCWELCRGKRRPGWGLSRVTACKSCSPYCRKAVTASIGLEGP